MLYGTEYMTAKPGYSFSVSTGDWLGISSANIDSFCGEEATGTLADALDGLDRWEHYDEETHWFILDLGQTYTIKKVRGRSDGVSDPTDVNIYIDDNNPPTTLVKEGITTWQDTDQWVEIDIDPPADGRYIKVEIITTEQSGGEIEWGRRLSSFTIFDAYGGLTG